MKTILKLLYVLISYPVTYVLEYLICIPVYHMTVPRRDRRDSEIKEFKKAWEIIRRPWTTYNIAHELC